MLGPNGAGKSTLLGILATLLRPTSGSGRATAAPTARDAAALRARIGVLGHDLFLYPELTARENLEFFAGLHGVADVGRARGCRTGHAPASRPAPTIRRRPSRAACVSGWRWNGR